LAEVLDAVEGPAASIPSRDGGGVREDIRAAEELATVWEYVSEAARGRLGLLTIEDIAARAAGGVPWALPIPTAPQSMKGSIWNNSYGFDIVDRDSQD
jgi:DNA-binding IscR family transcriptional regulator